MGNRIFTVVVLALWAASMSWLLVAKILPPFFQGEPPRVTGLTRQPAVCWQIYCDEKPMGWAVSQAVLGAANTTEIHSRVILEEIPLREMAPQWMRVVVDHIGPLKLDMRNRVTLDTLDNLASFDTKVRINDTPVMIKMAGRVVDGRLKVRVETGDLEHRVDYPAPKHSFLGGELTPDPKLLQMYVGRRWQREVYSPFKPHSDAMEIVQAEVVADDTLLYEGQLTKTKRVEYRSLTTAGVADADTLRATVWVAEDGTVLQQEVYLVHAKLRFMRQQDDGSLALATELLDLKTVATQAPPDLTAP
jgi:hypothetical protein